MATGSKLMAKPVRPQPSEAQVEAFIKGAPDADKPASAPAPAAQAAAAAVSPSVSDKVPRELRKRKEPITVTVAPALLVEFDNMAASLGVSRAAGLAMAMRHFIDAEKRRAV